MLENQARHAVATPCRLAALLATAGRPAEPLPFVPADDAHNLWDTVQKTHEKRCRRSASSAISTSSSSSALPRRNTFSSGYLPVAFGRWFLQVCRARWSGEPGFGIVRHKSNHEIGEEQACKKREPLEEKKTDLRYPLRFAASFFLNSPELNLNGAESKKNKSKKRSKCFQK